MTVARSTQSAPAPSIQRSDLALILAIAALILTVAIVLILAVGGSRMHEGSPGRGPGVGTMHGRMMDGPFAHGRMMGGAGWGMHFPRQPNQGGQR